MKKKKANPHQVDAVVIGKFSLFFYDSHIKNIQEHLKICTENERPVFLNHLFGLQKERMEYIKESYKQGESYFEL